jgi:predicted SprT family Zn-dependent metalloprotease
MLPVECEQLALKLMGQYGLTQKGWRFEFDLAYNRFGQCRPAQRLIRMSKVLVTFNTEEQCKDTILHEIAHALVGTENGHNHIWKHCAQKLGATPRACFGDEVDRIWKDGRINFDKK